MLLVSLARPSTVNSLRLGSIRFSNRFDAIHHVVHHLELPQPGVPHFLGQVANSMIHSAAGEFPWPWLL